MIDQRRADKGRIPACIEQQEIGAAYRHQGKSACPAAGVPSIPRPSSSRSVSASVPQRLPAGNGIVACRSRRPAGRRGDRPDESRCRSCGSKPCSRPAATKNARSAARTEPWCPARGAQYVADADPGAATFDGGNDFCERQVLQGAAGGDAQADFTGECLVQVGDRLALAGGGAVAAARSVATRNSRSSATAVCGRTEVPMRAIRLISRFRRRFIAV